MKFTDAISRQISNDLIKISFITITIVLPSLLFLKEMIISIHQWDSRSQV
jgi:hypothetical protein